MARLANVVRRAGIFHFRRIVPMHLRARLQRRELVRSLGTTVPATARLRADLLYQSSEHLFAAASTMLSQDQLACLVRDFYTSVLERDQLIRDNGAFYSEESRQARSRWWGEVQTRIRESLGANRVLDGVWAAQTAAKAIGLDWSALLDEERQQCAMAVHRAGIDIAGAMKARYDGDFDYEPKDKLLRAALAAETLASSAVPPTERSANSAFPSGPSPVPSAAPSMPQPASAGPTATTEPLLSVVGAAFRRQQHVTKTWDAQTAMQAGATYRLFIEVCEDRPLAAYGRQDADRFRSHIVMLPDSYSKAVQYRGLTVPQIVERAEAEAATRPVVRLSSRTVKRHFSALSTLWSSALSAGTVQQNIFTGFRFASAKRAQDQRPMWTPAELRELLMTPVWSGCKSEVRRTEAGPLVRRDAYYWIPLIGIFSGMRQEEICQLHVEDVRVEDGFTFFDLNERPPRQLKNATAIRRVPVHKELVRIGFLDHVAACRNVEEPLLFSALTRGGADNRLGHGFSKWFTRYRQDLGLYRRGLDFHALRHTATTLMHQAGVDGRIIDHVTGHTTPGETSRYTKGSTLAQLRDAIDRIDLGFAIDAPTTGNGLTVITGASRKPLRRKPAAKQRSTPAVKRLNRDRAEP